MLLPHFRSNSHTLDAQPLVATSQFRRSMQIDEDDPTRG
jgi:hypothetical protein